MVASCLGGKQARQRWAPWPWRAGRSLLLPGRVPLPARLPAQPQLLKAPHPGGPVETSCLPLFLFQPPSASPKPRRAVVPTTVLARRPLLPPPAVAGEAVLPEGGGRRWVSREAPEACLLLDVWFRFQGGGGGVVSRQRHRIAGVGGACTPSQVLFLQGSSLPFVAPLPPGHLLSYPCAVLTGPLEASGLC